MVRTLRRLPAVVLQRGRSAVGAARRGARRILRGVAVRFLGLPHAEGTVDAPSAEVAAEVRTLWIANTRSRHPAVDASGDAIVTMTTHGPRLANAWVAIESIARGEVRPRRLILWLDERPKRLPWRLRRLVARGVEVLDAPKGLGVYTKFWPHLESGDPLDAPLVLADDDMIYPSGWLGELLAAHRAHPDDAIAHRAHIVPAERDADGAVRIGPYTSWQPVRSTAASHAHFATSVSGQLLPPALQRAIQAEGRRFLELAPKADDIWLHWAEVRHGWRVRQVADTSRNYPFVPATQTVALNATNVFEGGNDRQFAACHTDETLAKIADDALER